MGNRAVITTKDGWKYKGMELGMYLHWNGGRDSVEAFLTYCKLHGYRAPSFDNYGWACLCKVVCNFFGDGLSCGVDIVRRLDLDNGDNGVYIIEGWDIVGREYAPRDEDEQRFHDLHDMLMAIDESQPEPQRLGRAAIEKHCKRMLEEMEVNEG